MAMNVVFPIPPTPPSSTDKINFRARYDAFFAYIQNLGTLLISFITQLNSTETNINAKEASATSSALACTSSANFQGTWVNQTTSVGESWAFNGIIYRVVIAGTTSPITTPANWLPITYKECVLATPVASATTTTIGTAASGDTIHITGTTTITSFGLSTTGTLRIVVFDGALTLTHNVTSLILPTGANIITAVGDTAEFVCENGASSYWRCTGYSRKDGTALSVVNYGFKNLVINGDFRINQRAYVSGTATTIANQYILDRWFIPTSGQSVAFSTTAGITTITAPASGVAQIIENLNVLGGNYSLSFTGTATASVLQSPDNITYTVVTPTNGVYTITGGNYVKITFVSGTVSLVQFEGGKITSNFEQRPVGLELSLCQRYYEEVETSSTLAAVIDGSYNVRGMFTPYKIVKRVIPTVTITGVISYYNGTTSVNWSSQSANSNKTGFSIDGTATGTASRQAIAPVGPISSPGGNIVKASAEL